jgi:hypothetical protein
MAIKVALKTFLERLRRQIELLFWRRPSKRLFSPTSFLRRDLLVLLLILMLGLSSQFFSVYASSQTVSSDSSTSQLPSATLWHRNLAGSTISTRLPSPNQVEKPNENVVPVPPRALPPSFISPFPYISPSPSPSPSSMNISLSLYKNSSNNNQSEILKDIDWPSMEPGEERNSSVIYFRNEGDLPFTMSFSTANWVFLDSSNDSLPQNCSGYFALSWNYDTSPLAVNEVRPVVFTLAVSSNIKDVVDFSFDIVITITSSN